MLNNIIIDNTIIDIPVWYVDDTQNNVDVTAVLRGFNKTFCSCGSEGLQPADLVTIGYNHPWRIEGYDDFNIGFDLFGENDSDVMVFFADEEPDSPPLMVVVLKSAVSRYMESTAQQIQADHDSYDYYEHDKELLTWLHHQWL